MSNVMSIKHLRNHVSRNAFDLSTRRCFTAKVGELLPVFTKEVLPGDKFKFGLQSFTRTMPVNSAAYTRIKEYYDYFFVPYRLLWRFFDEFIVQTNKSNPQFAKSILSSAVTTSLYHPQFRLGFLKDYLNALFTTVQGDKNLGHFNEFGFKRDSTSFKLLSYLGYGAFFNYNPASTSSPYSLSDGKSSSADDALYHLMVNAFPLLAYQKIYADYFRNTQWENNAPFTYNVDYLTGANVDIPITNLFTRNGDKFIINSSACLFDLRYCNWNKDLFTGVMPSPQYGDSAIIGDITSPTSIQLNNGSFVGNLNSPSDDAAKLDVSRNSNANGLVNADSIIIAGLNARNLTFSGLAGSATLTKGEVSQISVLALRQAEALQKWKEISLSGRQDYKDQIENHFGVSVPNVRSNMCDWIGGSSSNLDISEVVNNNLQGINDSGSSVAADVAGKGVGVMQGHESFEAKEHGIIMCIYHAVPLLDYGKQVVDPLLLKGSVYDYAIPEFDKIGMQPLPALCLDGSSAFTQFSAQPDNVDSSYPYRFKTLGYVPRYADYKTSIDTVGGAFETSLKYWVAPVNKDYLNKYLHNFQDQNSLNANFFKVNPSVMNPIFIGDADSSVDSDTFLINSYHDIKAVRNLDYDGLPY